MSTQLKFRRGTQAENDAFTGAEAEVVVDTTNDRLVVHDATRQGGFPVPNFKDAVNNSFSKGEGVFGSNIYVVTLDYDLDSYVDGQEILLTPDSNNTGACNININSIGSVYIKKHDGSGSYVELDADDLRDGVQIKLIYNSTIGDFVAQLGGGGSTADTYQYFTSSGTWTRPAGCTSVYVEVWGGGGGASGSGGGGTGGTSSFGAHCSATGGVGGPSGGAGGSGSGGDENKTGSKGGLNSSSQGGHGGSAPYMGIPTFRQSSAEAGLANSGAGSATHVSNGQGGGGGGYSAKTIDVTAISSVTVTIGAGGSASSGGQAGGSGYVRVRESY